MALRVGNENQYGASLTAPAGAGEYDGQYYISNAFTDALYRLKKVVSTAEITFSVAQAIGGTPFTATITWSAAVVGFDVSDLSVNVGTLGTFTRVSGSEYTVEITPPSMGSGNLTLTVAEDANDDDNDEVSESIAYADMSPTSATLTVSTTDTDIRARESVTFSITSNIDITDFLATDITVTGGTRGALTGSGTSWSLAVTAGSAGTLNIAIAEDAVSPGNAAVDEDFTINVDNQANRKRNRDNRVHGYPRPCGLDTP